MDAFVVVSGLPASGKTTLACELAPRLGMPAFDKDSFLESLFSSSQAPTLEARAPLSRVADAALETAALTAGAAIVTSWWRHPMALSRSGTPTAWLQSRGAAVVEVHCHCPASVALSRFIARQRHPGHADSQRDREELARQFEAASAWGPLFPERAITLSTLHAIGERSIQALADEVRQRLAAREG